MILNKGIKQLKPPKYSISLNSFSTLFHLLFELLFERNMDPLHVTKFCLLSGFIS